MDTAIFFVSVAALISAVYLSGDPE